MNRAPLIPLVVFIAALMPVGSAWAAVAEKVDLPVPHVWEIPDGVWVAPWSGACEEASVVMVDRFYVQGGKTISRAESKTLMQPLFGIQTRLFGYNTDTNAVETKRLIDDYSSVDAVIKKDPTVEDIKKELRAGRPVISMHYGYGLKNPLHAWRRGSSSYHMMVITGFDDARRQFLINDPELRYGGDFRYGYDLFMSSLHDFDHATRKANGPPVVLFTSPKRFVRPRGGHRIYLVRGNVKHYITRPAVFTNHRWSWSLVKDVDPSELEALETGASISE